MSTAECIQAEKLAAGCSFPYISRNITDSNGERLYCDETYAERISPWHTIQCLIHSGLSAILFLVLALWAINAYADYEESMPRKRGLEYRYKMHSFGALAALFNLLASVDLKGYAARLPLLAVETLNECAISALMCLLFHMVNQWVDVITLGGRQKWGKFQKAMLPYMCALVSCIRVGLGVIQWLAVPNGLRDGSYDGTLNSLKLFSSFLAMGAYTGIGVHASVYEPLQSKKAESKRDTARRTKEDGAASARSETRIVVEEPRGTAKAAVEAGKKKKVLRTGYLVGLFAILFLYMLYLARAVVSRLGKIEERGIPCTTLSKGFYTNQGVYIVVLLIYVYLNGSIEFNSAVGGGCAKPRSLNERRRIRVLKSRKRQEMSSAAAAKERKLEMAARKEKAAVFEAKEEVLAVEAKEIVNVFTEPKSISHAKSNLSSGSFDEEDNVGDRELKDLSKAHFNLNSGSFEKRDDIGDRESKDLNKIHFNSSSGSLEEEDDIGDLEDDMTFSPVKFASTFTNIVTGGAMSLDRENEQVSEAFSTGDIFNLLDFTPSRGKNRSGNTSVASNGTPPTVSELFDLLDVDGNGELLLQEVVDNHALLSMSRVEAGDFFRNLDPLDEGTISRKDFEDNSSLLGGVADWAGGLLGFGERPTPVLEKRKQAEKAQQKYRQKTYQVGSSAISFSGISGNTSLGSTL